MGWDGDGMGWGLDGMGIRWGCEWECNGMRWDGWVDRWTQTDRQTDKL